MPQFDFDYDKINEAIKKAGIPQKEPKADETTPDGSPIDIASLATKTPQFSTENMGENVPSASSEPEAPMAEQNASTPPKSDENAPSDIKSLLDQYMAKKSQAAPSKKEDRRFSDEALQQAINERDQRQANASFISGLNQLQAGFQRAPVSDAGYKAALAQAGQPVSDLMMKREAADQKIKHEQFMQDIAQQKSMSDPNSSISATYRQFAKALGNPVSDNVSATDLKQLTPLIERISATRENAAMRREIAEQNRLTKEAAGKEKSAEKKSASSVKRFDDLGKKLVSETSSSRSAFGRAANTIRGAEAIEQLTHNMNPNDIDSRQITEIARSLDGMLAQGQATVSGMEHLIPRTFLGNAAKIQEFITNIPTGTKQGDFVKRMMETVAREKELARDQIKRTQHKILSSYEDLEKEDPEKYDSMLKAHGIRTADETSKEQSKPKTVIQNGHTYTLNEQTGEYE